MPISNSSKNIDEKLEKEYGGPQMTKISYEAKISSKQLEGFFNAESEEETK